jgi:phenylpropionate dioxygenase-like ring-hydroxylating dioxygenase large terminal subunit
MDARVTDRLDLDAIRQYAARGRMPLFVYNDPRIYAAELQQVFARTWNFLGHESELPNPGDYVTRYIGPDSFLLVRGEDGQIRALFNACSHRGMQICNNEGGHATEFLCPYHGWSFDTCGRLRGVPFGREVYGPDGLDREQRGLTPIRLANFEGLLFGNMDPSAMPFGEYVGDFAWYLQLMTRRSGAGLKVVGAPQRWIANADWKLGFDNFIGDGYHTLVSHQSAMEGGALPFGSGDFLKNGIQIYAGKGGLGMAEVPPVAGGGWPMQVFAGIEQRLTPQQARLYGIGGGPTYLPGHGGLFPNFSFLNAASALEQGGPPIPYLTVRVWRPLGPGRMEIWSWCLVEADAPTAFQEASYRGYTLSFGASGVLEQDDTENWSSISLVAGGQMAQRHILDYTMGLQTGVQPLADWPGPGTAYPIDYLEENSRRFYREWIDHLCA